MGRSTRRASVAARRAFGEVQAIYAEDARRKQRLTEIVREAEDDGDWRDAGCTSGAQWLAQISSSDYRNAQRITRTSDALRRLPALDHAMSTGALTLDQVAAASEFATPATDAELARVAVGKAPSEIALAARTLAPPVVADDAALYAAPLAPDDSGRAGSASSRISGRLPLEQGAAFEHAIWSIATASAPPTSKPARSSTGSSPPPTHSSRSPGSRRGARRRAGAARPR